MSLSLVSRPVERLMGELEVPGDKSLSHRALILAALAVGQTTISGFLSGADNLATMNALRGLGVTIDHTSGGSEVVVHGVGLRGLSEPSGPLDMGNSGTGMRLLAGLLSWQSFATTLLGDESLSSRPMARIADPLREMGAQISLAVGDTAPINIDGGASLSGIDYTLPTASAQIKSSLLLAGLGAQGDVVVRELCVSRDHTERMMSYLGLSITVDPGVVTLGAVDSYEARPLGLVGDISSAAFFMVAASLLADSDVLLRGVGINPTRTGVIDILQRMGAQISMENICESAGGEPVADIRICAAKLHGVTIDAADVPAAVDELPVLMVAAACAAGPTVLTGAAELRVKESDRIQVVADGLLALGADVMVTDDGMVVQGGKLSGGHIKSHGDHRIAMAFAIAGAVASDAVIIDDASMVATSFPNFVTIANEIGMQVSEG